MRAVLYAPLSTLSALEPFVKTLLNRHQELVIDLVDCDAHSVPANLDENVVVPCLSIPRKNGTKIVFKGNLASQVSEISEFLFVQKSTMSLYPLASGRQISGSFNS